MPRPYELTDEQNQRVTQAKNNGDCRIVIQLTPEQSKLQREYIADVEDLVRLEFSGPERLAPSPLAVRLREAREAAKMSLADVGRAAGMTRQAVLAIEAGKNDNPKIDTLRRIAEAVGMELRIELTPA